MGALLPPLDHTSFEGTERFRVVRRLGRGGMGVVYEALDREQGTRVALKTLLRSTPEDLMRFKREFRSVADVTHPNLVGLGELYEERGVWFFTMEIVDGVPFMEWVRPGWEERGLAAPRAAPETEPLGAALDGDATRSGRDPIVETMRRVPLREDRLREALPQLVRGLSALHVAGKVHRDVKSTNVLVTASGRVVLLDFGVVGDTEGMAMVTDSDVVGTAAYMAPEQAAGHAPGPEADWYSVGVILYEALVGRPPFIGRSMDIVLAKQRRAPLPPSALLKEVPTDLSDLAMDLLRIDPARRPTASAILSRLGEAEAAAAKKTPAPASTATQTHPFVGRARELEALREAFAEVRRRGEPIAFFVQGESGLGKSALVRRFTDAVAHDEEAVLLAGRCHERESVPFKAVDGVVDALARWMQRLRTVEATALVPQKASLLLQVFPVLRRVPALAEAPRPMHAVVDPQELRTRVFMALRELLARLAERRPVVIVIDDLQWADADSLALLSELVRGPEAPPLLVLMTWRALVHEDREHASEPPRFHCEMRGLRIEPLPDDDAHALVRQLLVREGGSETAVDAEAIAREAQGHPMFIDELVRHAARGGVAAAGAPARLEEALRGRIEELGPEARRLVDLVAVAAMPLEQELAARALSMDLGEFGRHAALLRILHLVRTTGARGTDLVEAYHDRVRAAALARLSPAERQAIHRDLARALGLSERADPEAMAVHLRGAGELDEAAHWAGVAAREAMEALAFDRAARLFRLALELRPEPAARAREWRIHLGDVLAHAGRCPDAAHAYLAAVPGATAAEALDLKRRAAQQLLVSGHLEEGLEILKAVLASEGMTYPSTPARALARVLWTRLRLGLRGLGYAPRDQSQVSAAELARVDVCWHVGLSLSLVDNIRGNAFHARGLLLALAAGEPYRLARALAIEIGYVAVLGPSSEKFQRTLEAARKLADAVGDPHARALVLGGAGIGAFLRGEFAESMRLCETAEAIFRERCTGVSWELATVSLFTTRALMYLGDIAQLQRRVPEAIKEVRERGDLFAETSLRATVMPFVHLARGAVQEAEHEAADALSRWHPHSFQIQHYYQHVSRVSVDLYRGEVEKAMARLDEDWPKMRRALLFRVRFLHLTMLELRARVALAAARAGGADAKRHLAAAARDAQQLERAGLPWAAALAANLRAGIEARRDPARAAELLATAAERFAERGLLLHAAAARRRRGLLVGGDEGRALVDGAEAFMRAQRIADSDRWTDLLVPGF
jgi:serine/threonine protein kinase